MAEGGAEWEFYKENMLPSGEGRGVTALQEEARHAATKQRQYVKTFMLFTVCYHRDLKQPDHPWIVV